VGSGLQATETILFELAPDAGSNSSVPAASQSLLGSDWVTVTFNLTDASTKDYRTLRYAIRNNPCPARTAPYQGPTCGIYDSQGLPVRPFVMDIS
jgi:hypothetical protein